jgi:hypothetical protein
MVLIRYGSVLGKSIIIVLFMLEEKQYNISAVGCLNGTDRNEARLVISRLSPPIGGGEFFDERSIFKEKQVSPGFYN